MKGSLHNYRLRYFTMSFVSRCLAVFILCSFAVTLLPITTAAEKSSMPCCVGKAEGHCDSGLSAPQAPPVVTEPMCGLTSGVSPVTVATALVKTQSPHSAHHHRAEQTSRNAESQTSLTAESVSEPCRMDCSACTAAAVRQQKRQKALVQATHSQSPFTTTSRDLSLPLFFSANENWTQINPRGPPC